MRNTQVRNISILTWTKENKHSTEKITRNNLLPGRWQIKKNEAQLKKNESLTRWRNHKMKLHSVLSDFSCCNRMSENRSFLKKIHLLWLIALQGQEQDATIFSVSGESYVSQGRVESASGRACGRQGGDTEAGLLYNRTPKSPHPVSRERHEFLLPAKLPDLNRTFGGNEPHPSHPTNKH